MNKTKEEFVQFVRNAVNNRQSNEFVELYGFLLQCFVRADANLDGMVTADEFDGMIEEAAELPRKYGYAPKTADLYKTDADRKKARDASFKVMDGNNDGHISFDEWLAFAFEHIMSKVATLEKDFLVGTACTKEEFIAFIKKAMDKKTSEYKTLFHFLLKCFTEADKDRDGAVQPNEFDAMIEIAAQAPRRFGLAPNASSLYANDAARIQKRTEYFKIMDSNNDGNISLDEWVKFAMDHIMGKVASL